MFTRSNSMVVVYVVAAIFFNNIETGTSWPIEPPREVPIGSVGWTVQIRSNVDETFICSGAIIANRYVVTAARCFDNYDKDELMVYLAEDHIVRNPHIEYNTEKPKKRTIEAIYRHPEYQKNGSGHPDVAVLKLNANVNPGRNTLIVPLCNKTLPLTAERAVIYVTGWGHTDIASAIYTNQIRKGHIALMTNEKCREIHGNKNREIADTMFCAGKNERKNDCYSDVGSPAMYNRQLIGIASWGVGCGSSSEPSVFTNIMDVKDFIIDCINDRCTE